MVENFIISIIVPVYNAERHLCKCLDSLINQTYHNIEVICVNDGSSDNSLNILEKYAQEDSRIKIISQENQGVSVARNVGIQNVTGDYLLFVDADDWLDLNSCQLLVDNITKYNSDIIVFQYRIFWSNSDAIYNFTRITNPALFNNKYQLFNHTFDIITMIPYKGIWDKCYKKEFIIENNIFFKNMTHCEDSIFMLDVFWRNPQISLLKEVLYNYRADSENSASTIARVKYLDKLLIFKNEILKYNYNSLAQKFLKTYFYDEYLVNIARLAIYFTKDKSFLEILKQSLIDYDSDDLIHIKEFQGYNSTKKMVFAIEFHLLYLIYKYLIRPIGKYCLVLPYRKIKSLLRERNEQ